MNAGFRAAVGFTIRGVSNGAGGIRSDQGLIDDPVAEETVEQLLLHFSDFRRAYAEDGLPIDEFDAFPPTVRTLRQFIGAVAELDAWVRDVMLPSPD